MASKSGSGGGSNRDWSPQDDYPIYLNSEANSSDELVGFDYVDDIYDNIKDTPNNRNILRNGDLLDDEIVQTIVNYGDTFSKPMMDAVIENFRNRFRVHGNPFGPFYQGNERYSYSGVEDLSNPIGEKDVFDRHGQYVGTEPEYRYIRGRSWEGAQVKSLIETIEESGTRIPWVNDTEFSFS